MVSARLRTGLSHIGVVKTLWQMQLLPKIINGSSAGAIVASIIASHTDDELYKIFDCKWMNLNLFELPHINTYFNCVNRLRSEGVLYDSSIFMDAMKSNLGEYTFQESYNRTRRILNITVSSSTNYEMPRVLNYLTAPHVVFGSFNLVVVVRGSCFLCCPFCL